MRCRATSIGRAVAGGRHFANECPNGKGKVKYGKGFDKGRGLDKGSDKGKDKGFD